MFDILTGLSIALLSLVRTTFRYPYGCERVPSNATKSNTTGCLPNRECQKVFRCSTHQISNCEKTVGREESSCVCLLLTPTNTLYSSQFFCNCLPIYKYAPNTLIYASHSSDIVFQFTFWIPQHNRTNSGNRESELRLITNTPTNTLQHTYIQLQLFCNCLPIYKHAPNTLIYTSNSSNIVFQFPNSHNKQWEEKRVELRLLNLLQQTRSNTHIYRSSSSAIVFQSSGIVFQFTFWYPHTMQVCLYAVVCVLHVRCTPNYVRCTPNSQQQHCVCVYVRIH